MAEEKKNNQLDDVVYKKALREVVQEFKQVGEVRYSELTKRVSPLDLTSEQINDLIADDVKEIDKSKILGGMKNGKQRN